MQTCNGLHQQVTKCICENALPRVFLVIRAPSSFCTLLLHHTPKYNSIQHKPYIILKIKGLTLLTDHRVF